MRPHTIDATPLCLRAAVGSVNTATRTVAITMSAGAPVDRMDWSSGKRYREILSMKPDHVRLDRLNAGASLLDTHSAWSISSILGTVVPDSARLEQGQLRGQVHFSKRAAVEEIFQDVIDGVIRWVSIGYRVHKVEEDASKPDAIPTRTAVDWEPYEVSLVPMPADLAATVRRGAPSPAHPCVILTRARQDDEDRSRRFRLARSLGARA